MHTYTHRAPPHPRKLPHAPELVKVAHGVAEQEHGQHGQEVGVEGGAPHGVEAHPGRDLLAVGHLEADGHEVEDGPGVGGQSVHLELRVRLHVPVRACMGVVF